jgi:hypothetical protein
VPATGEQHAGRIQHQPERPVARRNRDPQPHLRWREGPISPQDRLTARRTGSRFLRSAVFKGSQSLSSPLLLAGAVVASDPRSVGSHVAANPYSLASMRRRPLILVGV